jgi:uncharacterized membrane protein
LLLVTCIASLEAANWLDPLTIFLLILLWFVGQVVVGFFSRWWDEKVVGRWSHVDQETGEVYDVKAPRDS